MTLSDDVSWFSQRENRELQLFALAHQKNRVLACLADGYKTEIVCCPKNIVLTL